jgi:hypothetical protein
MGDSMTESLHDHHLLAYTVSASQKQIRLDTAFPGSHGPTRATVIFEGVEAYYFIGDNLQTIIFDLTETTPEAIFKTNLELFAANQQYCWPGTWNESEAAVLKFLSAVPLKAWELQPAYGMGGWVWAREMHVEIVNGSKVSIGNRGV